MADLDPDIMHIYRSLPRRPWWRLRLIALRQRLRRAWRALTEHSPNW